LKDNQACEKLVFLKIPTLLLFLNPGFLVFFEKMQVLVLFSKKHKNPILNFLVHYAILPLAESHNNKFL